LKPELLETAVSDPPVAASRGTSFVVTDSVANLGNAPAVASITLYYLSVDATDRGRDQPLLGERAVPPLAVSETSTGTTTVTVPSKTTTGTYLLLVCADNRHDVQESEESNNCIVSSGVITITP
jgi:hypothetical protein